MSGVGDKSAVLEAEWLHRNNRRLEEALALCESPIERLLLAALLVAEETNELAYSPALQQEQGNAIFAGAAGSVFAQERIGKYRADFVLRMCDAKVVVECDGHDFHERTKEQARHDKARDRALVNGGFIVIRFTGSEVYADPAKCAREAFATLANAYRRMTVPRP